MFDTDAPGNTGGGAARHGALWLPISTTVHCVCLKPADHLTGAACDPAFADAAAVFRARTSVSDSVGGAAIMLARPTSAMLVTETTSYCQSGAAFRRARFLVAVRVATVLPAL